MDNLMPAQLMLIGVGPLLVLLVGAVWCDARHHRIPNALVFWGAGLGLLLNSVLPEGYGFISSMTGALGLTKALAGLGLGLVLMLPLYLLRALGAGDVKLMAMIGAFLGPNATIGTVLTTFIVGGVLTLLLAGGNRSLRRLLENVRVMVMSALIKATVFREVPKVDAAPETAGRMPYAVTIALGTIAYIALEQGGRMNFLKFF